MNSDQEDTGRVPILRLSDIVGDDSGTTDPNSDTAVTGTMWRTTSTDLQQNTSTEISSAPSSNGVVSAVHDTIPENEVHPTNSAHRTTPEEPTPTHVPQKNLHPTPISFHANLFPTQNHVDNDATHTTPQGVSTHLGSTPTATSVPTTNDSMGVRAPFLGAMQTNSETPLSAIMNTRPPATDTSAPHPIDTTKIKTPRRAWQQHLPPAPEPSANPDPLDIWEQGAKHTVHPTEINVPVAPSIQVPPQPEPDAESETIFSNKKPDSATPEMDLQDILTGFITTEAPAPNPVPATVSLPQNTEVSENKSVLFAQNIPDAPPAPNIEQTFYKDSGAPEATTPGLPRKTVVVPDIWDSLESHTPHQQNAVPSSPQETVVDSTLKNTPYTTPLKKLGEDMPDMWADKNTGTSLPKIPPTQSTSEEGLAKILPISPPITPTTQVPLSDDTSLTPPAPHPELPHIAPTPTEQHGISNLATLRAKVLKGSLGKPGDTEVTPLQPVGTKLTPRLQELAHTDLQVLQQATSLLTPYADIPTLTVLGASAHSTLDTPSLASSHESSPELAQTPQQQGNFYDTTPHETTLQPEYNLPLMRTFKQDVEGTVLHQKTTMGGVLLPPKNMHPMDGALVRAPKPKSTLTPVAYLLMGVSIVFILGGIFFGVMYFLPKTVPEEVTSYFIPEKKTSYDATSKSHTAIMQGLASMRKNTNERPSSVTEVFVLERVTLPVSGKEEEVRFTPSKLFTTEDTQIPYTLIGSLSGEFMLGFHQRTTAESFIIMKTNSFEGAFSGMLTWERDMANDLDPLFPTKAIQTTPTPSPSQTRTATYVTGYSSSSPSTMKQFEDITVSNTPARALRNDTGDIVLVWSMPDNYIIITTNTETLEEVHARLQTHTK